MKSARRELSNDRSHHAESALCQKLQNRHFIPKRYLDANILKRIKAKEMQKSFFSSTKKMQPTYIYCAL